MGDPLDAGLVQRVLQGEQDQYAALVRRYQETLYRHAVGMVGDADTAADLVQDSFVKAYASLATCQEPARFGAWVFRILRNRCHDHLRDRRRQQVPLDERSAPPDPAPGPEASVDRSQLRDAVDRALAELPEAQREAFLMKHVEELSYEEMAERVDASISALKMRVLRAREALQVRLRESVFPEEP